MKGVKVGESLRGWSRIIKYIYVKEGEGKAGPRKIGLYNVIVHQHGYIWAEI